MNYNFSLKKKFEALEFTYFNDIAHIWKQKIAAAKLEVHGLKTN